MQKHSPHIKHISLEIVGIIRRTLARVAVLAIGVLLAYLIPFQIFPLLDNKMPFVIAIFATYILSAYALLPAATRLAVIFGHRPEHIPTHNTTSDGFACDPVNVGIVGTRKQLETAMKKAGWHTADSLTLKTALRMAYAFVLRRPYPAAPFMNLFLFGRSQDIGFQLQDNGNPRAREHVRFWAVTNKVAPQFREHVHFWQRKINLEKNQKLLWVGAVTADIGFGVARYHGQFTHAIHPDTNESREFFVEQLKKTGLTKKTIIVNAGQPYTGKAVAIGDSVIADGDLKVVVL